MRVNPRVYTIFRVVDNDTKAPTVVIQKIREAILDGLYKPGDRLLEAKLAAQFKVSRSPVREALLALENEGTLLATPYSGAVVRPLSPEEVLDMAEVRLALIAMAVKLAYPHLSPADFDLARDLGKRITRTKSAKEGFECSRRFWDLIFERARRPILWETFGRLDNRMVRYYPHLQELYARPETRQSQREALIETYRKGEVAAALRAFKKIYLTVTHELIHRLKTRESANFAD